MRISDWSSDVCSSDLLEPVELTKGQDVDGGLDGVVRRLVDISYARVELVEKRGEFAVRGGILDVFPPTEEHPVRVEWWGDAVEEVRAFKVADQRRSEEHTSELQSLMRITYAVF